MRYLNEGEAVSLIASCRPSSSTGCPATCCQAVQLYDDVVMHAGFSFLQTSLWERIPMLATKSVFLAMITEKLIREDGSRVMKTKHPLP